MKKMSAIEMVRLCETADDWIAMICKQCKIRRPSKASYWFNVCEAVFESLKSALVKEMADEKRISDAVIQSLRDKKLEMAGEIADKDEEIARLRSLVKAREVVK